MVPPSGGGEGSRSGEVTVPTGLHPDIPWSRYLTRQLGTVRASALCELSRSPAHYYTWATCAPSDDDSQAISLGRATHMCALEPDRFSQEYIIAPEFGPCRKTDDCTSEQAKANKTRRDEWRRQHQNHQIMTAAEGEALTGMVHSMLKHPRAGRLLSGGMAEATVSWVDPETGLRCLLRADKYREDLEAVIDIKTTQDASPGAFARDIAKYGYGIADAHYRAGFAAIGKPARFFTFIAVEKAPPYAVAIYTLDAESVRRSYERRRELMLTMAECLSSGVWPAYAETISELGLPPWAY